MKKQFFKILAKLNKILLPSFSKRKINPLKLNRLQIAILGWRTYVTKRALKS